MVWWNLIKFLKIGIPASTNKNFPIVSIIVININNLEM